ncbi:hypothetical protein [Desulfosediminicola flagellatus]|uniref:hypothetical protein n=1 Tax=Desulfosediminicola flagellatus TaxID=2569541 RepID=UPI0010AD8FFE|nr:hypothetical protein [Desulfosediminicola flagellatus]
MKEVIGTFTVTGGTLRQQTVYITQQTVIDEKGIIKATIKGFTLNDKDGEIVERTKDQNTFLLEDGTILRKTSNVQLGDPEQLAPRINHRRKS